MYLLIYNKYILGILIIDKEIGTYKIMEFLSALSKSLMCRLLPGEAGMLGVVNLAAERETIDLTSLKLLPEDLEVVASGVNCELDKGLVAINYNQRRKTLR